MLMGIALLLRTARLLVAGFCVGASAVMTGIGIGGAEGVGAGLVLYSRASRGRCLQRRCRWLL